MWKTMIAILILVALPITSIASKGEAIVGNEEIRESVLSLHRSPNGRFMIWNECGDALRGDGFVERADRYAVLIESSIQNVKEKTGFEVPYKDVIATLFRESSHNECCVGRQEIDKLAKSLGHAPDKTEVFGYVKGWYKARGEASKECKRSGKDSTCRTDFIAKNYPQYVDISKGWDLGAAQYRFPNAYLHKRTVMVPSTGEIVDDIGLSDLMRLDVTIQLLVEDLAEYHEICKGHTHWLYSKWGHKTRQLSVDEAYYVHHHVGKLSWSLKYWKQMQPHFKVLNAMKQVSSEISLVLSKIIFGKFA